MPETKRTRRYKSRTLHQIGLQRALDHIDMRYTAIRQNLGDAHIDFWKRQFDLQMDGLYVETSVATEIECYTAHKRKAWADGE